MKYKKSINLKCQRGKIPPLHPVSAMQEEKKRQDITGILPKVFAIIN